MSQESRYEGCEVYLWKRGDVLKWLEAKGLNEYREMILKLKIDGDMLLLIPECNMGRAEHSVHLRKFWRELDRLRASASYKGCDPTGLEQFLRGVDNDYARYTYRMLVNGFNLKNVKHATEFELAVEGGIVNSVHRHEIMRHIYTIGFQKSDGAVSRMMTRNQLEMFQRGYQRATSSYLMDTLNTASASDPNTILSQMLDVLKNSRATEEPRS